MAQKCKRRKWSNNEKRMICAETVVPGVSVAQVERHYDLNANQIFNLLKDPKFAPANCVDKVAQPRLALPRGRVRFGFINERNTIRLCRKGGHLSQLSNFPGPLHIFDISNPFF